MKIFNLPDLGEGLAEAEIHEWYVAEGDEVKTEQPLCAVETAKALVDVPSPYQGKIIKLYGKAGDIIKTAAPLVAFETTEDQREDAGSVVGKVEIGNKILTESPTGLDIKRENTSTIKATPAVRALAKKLNIDLTTIKPSSPNGSISLEDLTETKANNPALAEPLRGLRRAMAINMAKAHKEVADVTLMDNADIQQWQSGEDITIRLIRAIIFACKTEPALNAHFDEASLSREVFAEINLGLALDTSAGLYVPVLKDITKSDAKKLRQQINQFKEQGKTQTFSPQDLQGTTITLSNFGMIAGRYANPIIMPPTVAIIGVGKLHEAVVAVDNKAVVHRILPLSITIDHRVVTGGEAARFLHAVIQDLEKSS